MVFIHIFLILNSFFKLYHTYDGIKIPSFVKKHNSYRILSNVLDEQSKIPIILDGKNEAYKKEVCQVISYTKKKQFIEVSYDTFLKEVPFLKYNNSLIYVNDFLIKNGRIFNEYETNLLNGIYNDSNMIVFNSDDLNNIYFKDDSIIKNYQLIKFPQIKKKYILLYIKNIIKKYNYHEYLYSLPWTDICLENLNFEMINMLIFELSTIKKQYKSVTLTKEIVCDIITELKTLIIK